jgi:23S rRNA pseudouridine1911/1915/1917 synthase
MKISIKKGEDKLRLDIFLSKNLTGFSRSQIQKKISGGEITVNGKTESSNYKTKEGDIININEKSRLKNPQKIIVSSEQLMNLEDIIIENNEEFLIINKPAGLIVHGAGHILEKTLADYLIERFPELKKIGEDPDRPSIVHRLDKEASGLMVIPKNQNSFDNLKKQFSQRTINKEYTALAHGAIEKENDIIDFPIKKSAKGYKMAAVPKTYKNKGGKSEAKPAATEFKVIKKFINFTLLKIKIKTGRTHQIRVHLYAYNHPIVGDKLYYLKANEVQEKKAGLNRIFLIADKLSFMDLNGKIRQYEINLPTELKKVLKIIK